MAHIIGANFTEPAQADCIKHDITSTAYIINGSITLFLLIFCILGNGSLIVIFITNKSVRNLNNRAVILLASTDLLRGLIVMVTKVVTSLGHIHQLPHVWCSITAVSSAFTFFFNPMILALIACIRYFVIVPWTKHAHCISLSNLRVAVLIIFSISILFSVLPFLNVGVYEFSIYHGVCFANWEEKNRVFRSIFYIFVIGVAFPILTISYAKLLFMLKQHNHKLRAALPSLYFRGEKREQKATNTSKLRSVSEIRYDDYIKAESCQRRNHGATTCSDIGPVISESNIQRFQLTQKTSFELKSMEKNDSHSESLRINLNILKTVKKDGIKGKHKIALTAETSFDKKESFVSYINVKMQQTRLSQNPNLRLKLSKQEYQITKLMFYIFLAYVICWFPAAVVNILALIDTCNVPEVWYLIIVTMVELKTCLNPLIYGLGNRQFRDKMKHFFKKYSKRTTIFSERYA